MNHHDLKIFIEKFKPIYAQVKNDKNCLHFLTKKYRHSIQVLQIGEEIARKDKLLSQENPSVLDLGKKALLFHDVGRFAETAHLFEDKAFAKNDFWFSAKYDHGVLSYEMMKNENEFNDVRILAALKHHGHMMEVFYADEEFTHISDSEIQRQMMLILRWVRDADKLSNFYIQKYENNLKLEPFFLTMSDKVRQAPVSEEVMAQFEAGKVILTSTIKSYCDRLICFLSWIFDLNYQASYQICAEQGYFDILLNVLAEYNHDVDLQQQITTRIHQELSKQIQRVEEA